MTSRRRPMAHRRRTTVHPRIRSSIPVAVLVILVAMVGLRIASASTQATTSPGASSAADTSRSIGSFPTPAVGTPDAPAASDLSTSAPTNAPTGVPAPRPATAVVAAPDARFPGGLLIADRGNGRLLVIDATRHVLWRFPRPGSLPGGQRFRADDAFLAPDGKTIVANDEQHQVIDRIDVRTRKVIWQYGRYDHAGSARGYLSNPDDAYPLANGNLVVADIKNCRIIEIAPSKRIVKTFGRSGVCSDRAPYTYGSPNGDTPLPDGGLLITEIRGSRVVRLSPTGKVLFDIHVPALYPSDAQLDRHGNVIVADYSNPGQVLAVSPRGRVLWRYGPRTGPGRLDHPSLATPLADGTVSINDDFRHRIVVLDPKTMRIVWQYGRTDIPGRGANRLFIPDGHQPIPAGTAL